MNMRQILLSLALLAVILPSAAFAIDLSAAKAKGLVGETTNGYLGAPNGKPSGEVAALIRDINIKRKAKYQQVATKVGKPLNVVEQLAGEKAQSKTQAGHYVQTSSGKWIKR